MEKERIQLDRFRDAARELGADESPDALDRVMGRLDLTKKPAEDLVHLSDCALHNAPARLPGECDCGFTAGHK